jgi:hypothetical protein
VDAEFLGWVESWNTFVRDGLLFLDLGVRDDLEAQQVLLDFVVI